VECYYVTGASRGIGRAIVERLLAEGEASVIGISRTAGTTHPRYTHRTLDLTQLADVEAFRFDAHDGADRVVLVNNAGLLSVAQVGDIDPAELIAIYQANALPPALLMNTFMNACESSHIPEALICSLTSRAGSIPIPGGGASCSAKAALERFTRVAARETQLAGNTRLKFLIANPGEVDTDMQSYLAGSDQLRFPGVEMVRKRKADGLLMAPQQVAERLIRVLRDPDLVPEMRFDVQDLEG
jgi:benzil reductase ((S)-benzoin forming)